MGVFKSLYDNVKIPKKKNNNNKITIFKEREVSLKLHLTFQR